MDSALDLKETKQEWIGNIPTHWDLKKIKFVFWNRNENNNPIKSENLISLTIEKGVIPHSEKTGGGNKPKDDLTKYKLVYPGDIVLNSMNVIAGAVGISKYFGVVSPVYYMLIPKDLDHSNEYFHHLFRTETFQKSLYGLGNGILIKQNEDTGKLNTIRMRIPMDKLGDQFIPVPPAEEQKLIAKYLDKKTNQIEMMIEKIQKKIELLKEQRIALIHQCITKGLDQNVEMKDSGVEWIGEIPRHWTIKKIKHLSQVKRGSSPRPIDDPNYFDENGRFSWVRIADVSASGKYLEKTSEKLSELGSSLSTKMSPGDLFLSIAGTVGKPIITKIECCIHDGFVWFDGLEINNDYLYYLFLVGSCFQGLGKMGTQLNLNTDTVGDVQIPCPTKEEQEKIVLQLEDILEKMDRLILFEQQRTNKLSEYRQSLISSVVTGKVRVTEDMI